MTATLESLDVFYGDLTVKGAYVYARLPQPAEDAGLSLAGQVRGPRCLVAETLPLNSPLVDLGPGPTLLARAVVPDPCFWSADLPAIYDVTVNLLRGTQIIATARREIGLRWLGAGGRNLVLEGKRWVLRGVTTTSTTATFPRHWHEVAAAYITGLGGRRSRRATTGSSDQGSARASPSQVDKDQLAEASQWGTLAVAVVSGPAGQLVARLRRLALHPAVAIAIIRGELPADFKPSKAAPNLLLAQPLGRGDELAVRPWAQMLWVEADDPLLVGRIAADCDLPLIATRRLTFPLPLDQARAACDELQRDLASIGQFAGYVV